LTVIFIGRKNFIIYLINYKHALQTGVIPETDNCPGHIFELLQNNCKETPWYLLCATWQSNISLGDSSYFKMWESVMMCRYRRTAPSVW